MKRKFAPFCSAAGYDEWWEVEREDMGFCKDGDACYTIKR